MSRTPVVVEHDQHHPVLCIRRGKQWAVTITHTEAVELANALIDAIEEES